MKRSFFAMVPIAASLASASAIADETLSTPASDPRLAKIMTVTVSDSAEKRYLPALVAADDSAALAFRISGELSELPVLAGMEVKEGDLLAALDKREIRLQLAKASAAYELAKVQFNRMERLRKSRVVSESDYDKAKSQLEEAATKRQQAKNNLSYTSLTAPYSGTISLRFKSNYEFVGANEPIMSIQTYDIVNVNFQLPERLGSRLVGQERRAAEVSFDTYPGQTFKATLKQLDTSADKKTGSYNVTLTLRRPEGVNVLPGMAAQVALQVGAGENSSIPKTAVIDDAGKSYVWKVDEGGVVSRQPVVLSKQGVLISGLNDGDKIVTNGIKVLKNGDKVVPWVKERGL
ncbi:efflux transporter periplasmic adaptor subunit [Veronia nyctiphanis]|uniref:Efflux transporter periplasmic adaptor subunit n=1 Tax=Veronia nyctiphanis TaxID=1278244 RepID=A0A4V1LT97_9GAMM|nr:efflux RND transporter periplasmic adaptor subunit [Veronia nyctiphanis]RXJ74438.1 efflux transporter periplasmic adaptor subunit [Veronia nyctiphanis]